MKMTLSDKTVIEASADKDEIKLKMAPGGVWPFGAHATLTIRETEELIRGLTARLKEAKDW